MKDRGPNWGLAFGSASFLIVWCLGFLANVAIETIAMRACVATMVGALLGIVVGQTLEGLRAMRAEVLKGSQVDFTVAENLTPPAAGHEASAAQAGATVPAAPAGTTSSAVPGTAAPSGAASATVPDASPAVGPDFQPLDFKSAARQIQATMKE